MQPTTPLLSEVRHRHQTRHAEHQPEQCVAGHTTDGGNSRPPWSFGTARRSFKSKEYEDILDIKNPELINPGEIVHLDGVGPIETKKALHGFEGCYTFFENR
jgi:hypothetical protein